jgi:hypothetical protein
MTCDIILFQVFQWAIYLQVLRLKITLNIPKARTKTPNTAKLPIQMPADATTPMNRVTALLWRYIRETVVAARVIRPFNPY